MRLAVALIGVLAAVQIARAAPPVILDDRLVIELAAEQPDIVTPTGLAVDEQGRVWIIENHTHQRPANYKGPASDRVRIFSDAGPDGKFRKVTTWADGFKNAMSISLRGDVVYLAERSALYRLRDTKGLGTADERKFIVKLDTPGDYPHNGLSGFAFDGLGDMYFSLGENLGASYKLIGSDGTTLSGGGEGGSIYRCKPDGSKLERFATGFWNTFHLTFDAYGRLFAVDNDPDARGPCRLLHIIQGGDYGYRFRNGRRGLHPFTAWNGELPGTLPMVAGTAEAPSGIVAYDHIGLPTEYRDKLLVTSWGDHVVESFTLSPRGASFSAKSTVLVKGGEDFQPVGIVTAPDGSLYLSDWVDKSYPVHGKGRIWRIRMKDPPKDDGLRPSKVAKLEVEQLSKLLENPRGEVRLAAAQRLAGKGKKGEEALARALQQGKEATTRISALWGLARCDSETAGKHLSIAEKDGSAVVRAEAARMTSSPFLYLVNDSSPFVQLQAMVKMGQLIGYDDTRQRTWQENRFLGFTVPKLADSDPFMVAAAIDVLGRRGNSDIILRYLAVQDARWRLGILLAVRRVMGPNAPNTLKKYLDDPDPAVRRAAIQWVAEEHLTEHKDAIAKSAAKEPVTRELFEALLAAQQMLEADPKKPLPESSGEEFVARIVKDSKQPEVFRRLSLRMLRPEHPALTTDLLKQMLDSADAATRGEAVRTLAQRADSASQQLLRQLATDGKAEPNPRAFAVLGLAQSAPSSPETRRLLLSLLADSQLQRDALRSLRDAKLNANEARDLFAWWDKLPAEKGDPGDERRELGSQLLLTLGPAVDAERRKQLSGLAEPMPANDAEWKKALEGKGDAAAGERVFFHLRGARCAVCHRIDGRGGQVGPELSVIASSHSRDKLIESILTPSKEIAPAYTTWIITMADGKKHTGVIVGENFDSTLTLADENGKQVILKKLDIENRQASPKSLMPDDLHKLMTRREFVDVLEFLSVPRR
jgi:putative membrane-bound dehydrogenase-like protein